MPGPPEKSRRNAIGRSVQTDAREKRSVARKVAHLLGKQYGAPPKRSPASPLDMLVQTILSQNTNDHNSHRAFEALKQRFADWNAVVSAPTKQIETSIRVGGLAKTKARRIKAILSRIRKDHGQLSLDWLCDMRVTEALEALCNFEGVGPKTIRCVLLFACGMDVFPVDTHILRISKRLGLIPEMTTADRAHKLWDDFLPKGLAYSLHLGLIEHGRRTCLARRPKCQLCRLNTLCRYYRASSPG